MEKKSKAEFEALVRDALVKRGHGGVKSVSISAAGAALEARVEHDRTSSFPEPGKQRVDDVLREMETLYGRPEDSIP